MADDRPIIFGPGDKLRWLEIIATDSRATAFDVRLAVAITNRIDKFSGLAVIGQEWLAQFIGGTARGVRKAADHLESLGHVEIERAEGKIAFGGRGKANVYKPKTRNGGSGFNGENPERSFRVYGQETRNGEALNPERPFLPYLILYQRSYLRPPPPPVVVRCPRAPTTLASIALGIRSKAAWASS